MTRRPVLTTWTAGSALITWVLVSGAREKGRDVLALMPMTVGLSIFCGLGFAALVVPPVFFLLRLLEPPPEFVLPAGERMEWEFPTNHLLYGESRGGRGFLTDQAIHFQPHRFNVQLSPWSLRRESLVRAEVAGARLCVLTTAQGEELLVLERPDELTRRLARK